MPSAPRSLRARPSFALPALGLAAIALAALVVRPPRGPTAAPVTLRRATADLAILARAFNAHFVDTGSWPEATPGDARREVRREVVDLACLFGNVGNQAGWRGPYLDLAPGGNGGRLVDPWGHPYLICYVPQGHAGGRGAIHVYSRGPDGRLDTGPEDVRRGTCAGDDLAAVVTRAP